MTAEQSPPVGAAPVMVFRSPELRSGDLSCVGAAVVLLLVGLVAAILGTASLILAAGFLAFTLAAWVGIRAAIRRLRVDVYDTGIHVLNIGSSTWIPWNRIVAVSGGGQLRIDLVDGQQVVCFAVGRSGYGWMTGRPGYDDQVADQILRFWRSK